MAQDHAQEAADHAAEPASGLTFEELPTFIEGHIADGKYIEGGGAHGNSGARGTAASIGRSAPESPPCLPKGRTVS